MANKYHSSTDLQELTKRTGAAPKPRRKEYLTFKKAFLEKINCTGFFVNGTDKILFNWRGDGELVVHTYSTKFSLKFEGLRAGHNVNWFRFSTWQTPALLMYIKAMGGLRKIRRSPDWK